jgi:uncharacterized membrane protein
VNGLVLLKLVHVVAAIVAVGSNVTYAFWLRWAGRDRDRLVATLDGIRRLDSRVANPAYGVLLATGVWMVLAGAYSFTTFWIDAALVLYVTVAVIGGAVYGPAVRRQMNEAERDPNSAGYVDAERRSTILGAITLVLVLAIVTLMVTKPTL